MFKKALPVIFLLSLAAWSLWLYEILNIKGWYSLNWLSGILYTPYAATGFTVLSFLIPFILNRVITLRNVFLPLLQLYTASILCFEIGKIVCYRFYNRFIYPSMEEISFLFFLSLTIFVFLGIAYWFITDRLIIRNKKLNIIFITFAALLVVPLSILTIMINSGYGHGDDWIDAVKMGYPVFWITMMMGISGIWITRKI